MEVSSFIIKHSWAFLTVGIFLIAPAVYGNSRYDVYYKLDSTLPSYLGSVEGNEKLSEVFNMNSTHILLADSKLSARAATKMMQEMDEVDGIQFTLGYNTLAGPAIPEEVIPESVRSKLKSGKYQLILIGSEYGVASDEVNRQIAELNEIIEKHDPNALLIGEAPATKDLVDITDKDFKTVSILSIAVIFLIILVTFKSVSLPVILVSVIELAIMINMGLAFYFHTELPFVASVVIGTIQLGATVDYAILMTTRYRAERCSGKDKKEAVSTALRTSIKSVITSGLGFFAATIGVALYSDIGMVSSLCMLLARGALISMAIVITVLPSLFMIFDGVIIRTSKGFKPKAEENAK